MASITENVANHFVMYDVPWDTYSKLLDALGDRRLRHSYDDGTFEMMSPLKDHEWVKKMIGRFIEAASLELDIPIQSIGSTTLRRGKVRKGLEPDECYYIRHEREVRHRADFDAERDPPPDLAVEVDVTRSSVSRMEIYASLGIPEVWHATKDGVAFHRLSRSGQYTKISRSKAIPLLTAKVVNEFLALRVVKNETMLVREFVQWVRKAKGGKTN